MKFVVGIMIAVLALSTVYLLVFANSSQSPTGVLQAEVVTTDNSIASLPVAPTVGARAPDFTLANMNGDQVSLNEFNGKPVVISFFHTW